MSFPGNLNFPRNFWRTFRAVHPDLWAGLHCVRADCPHFHRRHFDPRHFDPVMNRQSEVDDDAPVS